MTENGDCINELEVFVCRMDFRSLSVKEIHDIMMMCITESQFCAHVAVIGNGQALRFDIGGNE